MFFSINGVAVYRFKKPSFWFIWFVQKPYVCLIMVLASIAIAVWAIIALVTSVIGLLSDPAPISWEQVADIPSSLTMGVALLAYAWLCFKAYDSIYSKRKLIVDGGCRDFYVTKDDYSYMVMFDSGLEMNHPLPKDTLHALFEDQSVFNADASIRRVDEYHPDGLRIIWEEQRRILDLIQAHYLGGDAWTYEIGQVLQQWHSEVDVHAVTFAHTLLNMYADYKEDAMELMREIQTQAS